MGKEIAHFLPAADAERDRCPPKAW
jgi:hypothetical protein